MTYTIMLDGLFYLRNKADDNQGGWSQDEMLEIIRKHPSSNFRVWANA